MNIYKHLSYRTLLEEWYTLKKNNSPLSGVHSELRFFIDQPPGFVEDVIRGHKSLNIDLQKYFLAHLNLSADEKEYVQQLFILEHATSTECKHAAIERLSAMRRMHSTFKIEGESYRYLSRWYCPAIRELSMQPNFKCDPQWIRDRLRPKITLEQANEALQILQDLKMLSFTSPTDYTTEEGSFSTPMQVRGLAVHNYHEQMLGIARESVQSFPQEQRHLLGATVSINKKLIPILKDELNAMIARILDICESDSKPKNHTIQVGIHFFPLVIKDTD